MLLLQSYRDCVAMSFVQKLYSGDTTNQVVTEREPGRASFPIRLWGEIKSRRTIPRRAVTKRLRRVPLFIFPNNICTSKGD
jgi:hypothetical protein